VYRLACSDLNGAQTYRSSFLFLARVAASIQDTLWLRAEAIEEQIVHKTVDPFSLQLAGPHHESFSASNDLAGDLIGKLQSLARILDQKR
jgi:hypothetical protein